MYDRTGLSTKCTLIKIDLFRPSDPNSDLFRPFVEALVAIMDGVLFFTRRPDPDKYRDFFRDTYFKARRGISKKPPRKNLPLS